MTAVVIFFHTIICIFLVIIILMQSGRGGGLTENFAAAENVFGAKTNEFLIKGTTLFAILYFVTSLGLAFLSSKKDESLMKTRVSTATVPMSDVMKDLGLEEPITTTPNTATSTIPNDTNASNTLKNLADHLEDKSNSVTTTEAAPAQAPAASPQP